MDWIKFGKQHKLENGDIRKVLFDGLGAMVGQLNDKIVERRLEYREKMDSKQDKLSGRESKKPND